MATKNTPAKKPAAKKPAAKPTAKKPAATKKTTKTAQNNKKNTASCATFEKRSNSTLLSFISYGIGVCAILLLVLFIVRATGSDAWFVFVCDILYGILSYGAWTVPLMMLYLAIFLPLGQGKQKNSKLQRTSSGYQASHILQSFWTKVAFK